MSSSSQSPSPPSGSGKGVIGIDEWRPKIRETVKLLQGKNREDFFSVFSSTFSSAPTSPQGRWIYITLLLAIFAHHWSYEVTRMLIKQTSGRQLFEFVLRPFHPWFTEGGRSCLPSSSTIELKAMPLGLLLRPSGQAGFTFSLENEDFCQRLSILAAESVVSVMADELGLFPMPEWSSPNSSLAKKPPSLFLSSSPREKQFFFFGAPLLQNIGDIVSKYEAVIREQGEREEAAGCEGRREAAEVTTTTTKISPYDLHSHDLLPPCIRRLARHEYRKRDHPDNLERLVILFFLTKFETDRTKLLELMKPFCPAGISDDFVTRMDSMVRKGGYSGGCSFVVSKRLCAQGGGGATDIEECQLQCSSSDPDLSGLSNFSPHTYFARKKQAKAGKVA